MQLGLPSLCFTSEMFLFEICLSLILFIYFIRPGFLSDAQVQILNGLSVTHRHPLQQGSSNCRHQSPDL